MFWMVIRFRRCCAGAARRQTVPSAAAPVDSDVHQVPLPRAQFPEPTVEFLMCPGQIVNVAQDGDAEQRVGRRVDQLDCTILVKRDDPDADVPDYGKQGVQVLLPAQPELTKAAEYPIEPALQPDKVRTAGSPAGRCDRSSLSTAEHLVDLTGAGFHVVHQGPCLAGEQKKHSRLVAWRVRSAGRRGARPSQLSVAIRNRTSSIHNLRDSSSLSLSLTTYCSFSVWSSWRSRETIRTTRCFPCFLLGTALGRMRRFSLLWQFPEWQAGFVPKRLFRKESEDWKSSMGTSRRIALYLSSFSQMRNINQSSSCALPFATTWPVSSSARRQRSASGEFDHTSWLADCNPLRRTVIATAASRKMLGGWMADFWTF